jgi:apolipoprotein D and lipocalin family protein
MTRLLPLLLALLLSACQSMKHAPLSLASNVDLARFMGDWYVIAHIPTFLEKHAYNALESYRLGEGGVIETTFTFRAGAFDGEEKRYTPRGFVSETGSNAIWRMQFLWPFKADYRIAYLNADYTQTVIGREKRDYVWIMARTPQIADADYGRLLAFLGEQGYDTAKVRKVPQRWDAAPSK